MNDVPSDVGQSEPRRTSSDMDPVAGDDERQSVLVTQLIEADDERRRRHQSGESEPSTFSFSVDLAAHELNDLSHMLHCATQLEQLADSDTARTGGTTPSAGDFATQSGRQAVDEIHDDYHIGHYHVLRRIADGGFGAVLLAVDERNQRRVALKVPRPDILLTSRLQERFLIEGRAAATLNHPNVVSVYETLSEPVPAIAFEYCEGGTLNRAADRVTSERTAIEIVLRLAEALQHAHTRGVLHRDVKPGNVLLVHADAQQHEFAVEIDGEWWIPKLGDFGLAKLLDESVQQTQTGMVMGTAQFMAPEQAAGRVSELGTHTDVFSLGAIFYWLLVGRPPFEGHGTLQTLKLVETTDAPPPRRLRRDISAKTDAVCLKCLRRPIDARYPSAAALADDLRHLLRGEPVSVRPPNVAERLRQWGRRNPALAVVAIMLPLAAACGLLLQWNNNRALQEYITQLDTANRSLVLTTQQAEDARLLAERRGYASDLQLAQRGFESGDLKTYGEALDRHVPTDSQTYDLRGPEWQELWDRGHPPATLIDEFPSAVYSINLSRDGAYLVASGADTTIRVYDTRTWQRLSTIESGQQEVNYASFSSDGARIASAGDDGTIAVWNWQDGKDQQAVLRIPAYDDAHAFCVQFYDNDTALATCGRHPVIRLWEADSGKPTNELTDRSIDARLEQLDVSDDGRWLAVAAFDGRRRVWDLQTNEQVESRKPVDGQHLTSVCLFQRDNETWMLSGTFPEQSRANCTVILEVLGGDDLRSLPIHFDGISSVAADAEGQLAVAGDGGGRISLIDINAAILGKRWWYPETVRKSWLAHTGRVYGLIMTDGGRSVISAGEDGQLIHWDTDRMSGATTLTAEAGDPSGWIHAAQAPDRSLYLVDQTWRLHHWNPQTQQLTKIIDADSGKPLLLEPREDRAGGSLAVIDNRLIARSWQGPVCCWEIEDQTARLIWTAPIDDLPDGAAGFFEMALSADRQQLAICRRGHPVHNYVVDARTGQVLRKIPVQGGVDVGCRAIAFDQSGKKLAFGNEKDVFVHDLQTQQQMRLAGHTAHIRAVCFVPGTNLLISGANDRKICVWDLSNGKLVRELTGHRAAIECLGLHPQPNRLISSDLAGWVRIWSLSEGMLLSELPPPDDQTRHASLGADLVGISANQTVFQMQLRSPQPK